MVHIVYQLRMYLQLPILENEYMYVVSRHQIIHEFYLLCTCIFIFITDCTCICFSYPDSQQFFAVCLALVRKYPALQDRVVYKDSSSAARHVSAIT